MNRAPENFSFITLVVKVPVFTCFGCGFQDKPLAEDIHECSRYDPPNSLPYIAAVAYSRPKDWRYIFAGAAEQLFCPVCAATLIDSISQAIRSLEVKIS